MLSSGVEWRALSRCSLHSQNTKAAKEVQVLADFYAMMAQDSARAFYGPAHVQAAHELGAVQTLLLTDTLLRVNNVAQRRRYASLVDEVKGSGGDAFIFSGVAILPLISVQILML